MPLQEETQSSPRRSQDFVKLLEDLDNDAAIANPQRTPVRVVVVVVLYLPPALELSQTTLHLR